MQFAQDTTRPEAVDQVLAAMAEAADGLRWHVLYDSAFALEEDCPGVNCYAFDSLTDLAPVAPRIVPLPARKHSGGDLAREVGRWLARCSSRPMLGFIASPLDAEAIAENWASLHMVRTEDGDRLLLRIADTRTLPALQRTLLPAQWAALVLPLKHWLIVDRCGAVMSLGLHASGSEPAQAPLILSGPQVDHLVESAEADALIAFFEESLPDLMPSPTDLLPSLWHRRVDRVLKLAREHDVDRLEDKVALIQAAQWTDEACLRDERVLAILHSGSWRKEGMSEALLATGMLD